MRVMLQHLLGDMARNRADHLVTGGSFGQFGNCVVTRIMESEPGKARHGRDALSGFPFAASARIERQAERQLIMGFAGSGLTVARFGPIFGPCPSPSGK